MLPSSHTLHATAALVMQWGYPAFSGRAKLFSDHLDLTAAQDLIVACESECPWYGEVIANRKTAIRHLASGFLRSVDGPVNVLIPAAGWSPLALELMEVSPHTLQVIELDIAGMEEKSKLYQEIAPDMADRIQCVTTDITSPDILARFLPDGTQSLLVILEGITYFMDSGWVEQLIQVCSGYQEAGYIIEYLLPASDIKPERRHIADHVFSVVADACSCQPPVRYSPGLLRDIACRNGYTGFYTMTVREMERLRIRENQYFIDDRDGWIAVSMIRK